MPRHEIDCNMHPLLDEARFIRIYRELTGVGESPARSVFMFVASAGDAAVADAREELVPEWTDHRWEEEYANEPATESRALFHVHQLPDAARERFA